VRSLEKRATQPPPRPLSAKERRFVDSYIANRDEERAYRDAGYRRKDAIRGADGLMKDRRILVALVQRLEAQALQLQRATDAVDPAVQGASTVMCYGRQLVGEVDASALVQVLRETSDQVDGADVSRACRTLAIQAQTLDAIFNELSRIASPPNNLLQMEPLLKLAFRAQSQCRATWEAISAIRHPPLAGVINQANIAGGHQQVINGGEPRPQEKNPPSKLMEAEHEQE
jgi:phage terminase small subunit